MILIYVMIACIIIISFYFFMDKKENLDITYQGVKNIVIREDGKYKCYDEHMHEIPCDTNYIHLFRQTIDPIRECHYANNNLFCNPLCVNMYQRT